MKQLYPSFRSRIQVMIQNLESMNFPDTLLGFRLLNTACRLEQLDRHYVVDACEHFANTLTRQSQWVTNYVGMGFVWVLVADYERAFSYYQVGEEKDKDGFGLNDLKISLAELKAYLNQKIKVQDIDEVIDIVDLDIFRFLLRLKENLVDISSPCADQERYFWLKNLYDNYMQQYRDILTNIKKVEDFHETTTLQKSLNWAEIIMLHIKENLSHSKDLIDIKVNHLDQIKQMLYDLFKQQRELNELFKTQNITKLESRLEDIIDRYEYVTDMIEYLSAQDYDVEQVESYRRIISNYIEILQDKIDS